MIDFIFSNLKLISGSILGFFVFYLFNKNNKLSNLNLNLKEDNLNKDKILNLQERVINVTQNTKTTDFDGIIDLMHKDKL